MTFKIAWASVVYLGQLRQVLTKRPRTAHGIPVQLCFVAPVYRIHVRTTRIEVTLEINCVNDLDRWSKEGDTYIMILIIILLMRWFAMFESFKRLKHIFPNKSNKVHSPFPFTRPWGGRLGDPGKGQRQLSESGLLRSGSEEANKLPRKMSCFSLLKHRDFHKWGYTLKWLV